MSILLGSSQAQVVTDQNGLASIVPSAGSVGPCDVFIAVSAGASTAQLQMESVAAIVPAQPANSRPQTPAARTAPRFSAPTPAPQGVPDALFAVPEGFPLDDPATSQSPCSDARQDSASSTDSNSGASGTSGADDVVPRSCEPASELPHVESEPVRPPVEPSVKPPDMPRAESTDSDKGGGAAPLRQPAEIPSSPSANDPSASSSSVDNPAESKLLEDKRSCRFAQSEDGIFFVTTE
jgi:hypothetical protein